MAAVTKTNTIAGYGVLTRMQENACKIGPLLAETAPVALILLKHLLQKMPQGSKLMLVCFQDSLEAKDLLTKLGGMSRAHVVEVLYTKHQIDVSVNEAFFLANAGNVFT